MYQTGLAAFNDFKRDNFSVRSGYNLSKWLKASVNGEYIKSGGNRSYQSGQQFIWAHRSISWEQHRNWRDYVDTHIQRGVDTDPPNWQHTFFTNPFYTNEMLPTNTDKDRLLGNISLTAKIMEGLNLMLRSGTDVWSETRISIGNFERIRNGNRTPCNYS